MAGQLGKFQMLGFNAWNPHISKVNHISALYKTSPQLATDTMVELLAWNTRSTLESYLSKFPTKEFDSDDEYTWDIIGSTRRAIPLIEARATVSGQAIASGSAGANTTPFYLVFGEDWFNKGEVIVGNLNEVYPLRIRSNARMEGSNAVYEVELMGGVTDGIPAERLQFGELFTVEYAPVERELSRKVGGIRHASPVAMRNEFSTIRMFHKVSGALLNKKVACGIPLVHTDEGGRVSKSVDNFWMHEVEWQFEKEWSNAKNNILAFGRSNRNANGEYMNIGESGEVIRMGAGLYEQMESAYTHYYNDFSLKMLENILNDLAVSKLDVGEREFILRTGTYGAAQFHKAVCNQQSGWTQFQYNADNLGVVKKVAAAFTGATQALGIGYQYTEYFAPNGVHIKVEVDPFYDDPVRNKIKHPLGGPAFSYRYDIFDIGTMNQPNIFKVAVKGKPEYRGYRWGLRNPFTGSMDNPYMSYDEDSAEMHRMTSTGICVLDPTRTMSLIPAILQG